MQIKTAEIFQGMIGYTAKNEVDENSIEQYFAAHIVLGC